MGDDVSTIHSLARRFLLCVLLLLSCFSLQYLPLSSSVLSFPLPMCNLVLLLGHTLTPSFSCFAISGTLYSLLNDLVHLHPFLPTHTLPCQCTAHTIYMQSVSVTLSPCVLSFPRSLLIVQYISCSSRINRFLSSLIPLALAIDAHCCYPCTMPGCMTLW